MSDSARRTVFIDGPKDFNVELSALDARHGLYYSRRLHVFRCESPEQRDVQQAALTHGLAYLLQRCPILGGTVAAPRKDLWRDIVPGQCGIELVVKDNASVMPLFSKLEEDTFQPCHFLWDLFMPIPEDLDDRAFPAMKVQFTSIDGGTVITFSMSHCVADGNGMDEMMRILIDHIRLGSPPPHGTDDVSRDNHIGMDRSPIQNITSATPFHIEDHPAYRWRSQSLAPQSISHPFEATRPERPYLFRIPPARLQRLKADAAQVSPDALPISTHDALVSLIWRSILLVRHSRDLESKVDIVSTPTYLFLPSDARKHLGLPQTYVGNAVYQLFATSPLHDILDATSGLRNGAAAMRRAVNFVNPERVASYMHLINNDPDSAADLGWQFENGTASSTGVAMGTCYGSSVLCDEWGGPFSGSTSFRLVSEEGTIAIMPKLPDGTAEIIVSVMEHELPLLMSEDCLGKYIEAR